MKMKNTAVVVLVLVFCLTMSLPVLGAEDVYKFSGSDTIRDVLKKNKDKRVYIMLEGGGELTGTITAVGDGLVHVSKLGGGMDYYDAAIRIDNISGVKYKARGFK